MSELLPNLSPHSQFPYPYDKPMFVSYCKMHCGKLNQIKKRYIAISRNCLYYFRNKEALLDEKSNEGDFNEYSLAVGVIPLNQCVAEISEGRKTVVLLKDSQDKVPIRYIRILSDDRIVMKSKKEFCFEFCSIYDSFINFIAVEEEALYFVESILEHVATTHPFDAVMTYNIEFSIMSLRELSLIEREANKLLKEIKEGYLPC